MMLDDVDKGQLHLRPLPDEVQRLLAGSAEDVLALVREEYQRWTDLHDRLIALIAALVDDAVEQGSGTFDLLERVVARTSVGVDALVGAVPTPEQIAALLRSHHSRGDVTDGGDTVSFDHVCGTGLTLWRRNPALATVEQGEVPGVPAGIPRYCARCMHTIASFGQGKWRVTPPTSPDDTCHWEIDRSVVEPG